MSLHACCSRSVLIIRSVAAKMVSLDDEAIDFPNAYKAMAVLLRGIDASDDDVKELAEKIEGCVFRTVKGGHGCLVCSVVSTSTCSVDMLTFLLLGSGNSLSRSMRLSLSFSMNASARILVLFSSKTYFPVLNRRAEGSRLISGRQWHSKGL